MFEIGRNHPLRKGSLARHAVQSPESGPSQSPWRLQHCKFEVQMHTHTRTLQSYTHSAPGTLSLLVDRGARLDRYWLLLSSQSPCLFTLAGARRRWFRFPLAAATAASVGGCHSCQWSSFAAATAATAEQLPQLSSCHSCHSCQGDAKHGALVHVCMHLSMIGSMVKCMCACICP